VISLTLVSVPVAPAIVSLFIDNVEPVLSDIVSPLESLPSSVIKFLLDRNKVSPYT